MPGLLRQEGMSEQSSDVAGGSSDGGLDPSSGHDGCSSEDEQGRSGTRKNIPWDEIDEQRLLVYHERGQVLGVDLPEVARQNFGHSAQELDHGTSQARRDFLSQAGQQINVPTLGPLGFCEDGRRRGCSRLCGGNGLRGRINGDLLAIGITIRAWQPRVVTFTDNRAALKTIEPPRQSGKHVVKRIIRRLTETEHEEIDVDPTEYLTTGEPKATN